MGNRQGPGRDGNAASDNGDGNHVIVTPQMLAEIHDFAALQWPEEACGLLIAARQTPHRITRAVFALNVAEHPLTTFEIDPQTLIDTHRAARERGEVVVGCFHSHPNGKALPSTTDRERADENGFLWLVIATDHKSALSSRMYRIIHQKTEGVANGAGEMRYFRRCQIVNES